MTTLMIEAAITEKQQKRLQSEFPQHRFVSPPISLIDLKNTTILYSQSLDPNLIESLPQLSWIHLLSSYISEQDWDFLKSRPLLTVTHTRQQLELYLGELTLCQAMMFGMQMNQPTKNQSLQSKVWRLQNQTLLQIGLGTVGKEIAHNFHLHGTKVWGVHSPPSYNPSCIKIFEKEQIHSLLPYADIVSIAMPKKSMHRSILLGENELKICKKGAILIITGAIKMIDLQALKKAAEKELFSAIIVNAVYGMNSQLSTLKKAPNIYINHNFEKSRPINTPEDGFHFFRYNLIRFLYGKTSDMINIAATKND